MALQAQSPLLYSPGGRMKGLREPAALGRSSAPCVARAKCFAGASRTIANFALLSSSGSGVVVRALTLRFPARRGRQQRLRRGGFVRASSGSSRDEGDEVEQGEEAREVLDVASENGTAKESDPKAEADRKYRQDYKKFKEALLINRKRFWHNFKEQHVIYGRDRDEWGVGMNPIFTVHVDADGKFYKVDVDEEEVQARCGVDPRFPQWVSDEAKTVAEQRVAKANAIAREIEDGLFQPNELSFLYRFEREGVEVTGSEFVPPPNFLPKPLQDLNAGNVFALSVVAGFVYKWWTESKGKAKNTPPEDPRMYEAMKARKLKAKMNEKLVDNPEVTEGNSSKVVTEGTGFAPETQGQKVVYDVTPSRGKPGTEDEEYRRRVQEIRAMARRVREEEEISAEAQRKAEGLLTNSSEKEGSQKKISSEDLESLSESLDAVRRLGHEAEKPELTSGVPPSAGKSVGRGKKASSLEGVDLSVLRQDDSLNDEEGSHIVGGETSTSEVVSQPEISSGVKPRVILSPKEARASIAAKRARLESGALAAGPGKPRLAMDNLKAKIQSKRAAMAGPKIESGTSKKVVDGVVHPSESIPSFEGSAQRDANGVELKVEKAVDSTSESPGFQSKSASGDQDEGTGEGSPESSREEEEEKEWMNDKVLKDIVFKVQANEEAGREPFFGLDSEQEKRFFKGLERKFKREGEKVKSWIKDRVENLDYGADGVSLFDPPEAYTAKLKEGVEVSDKAKEFARRFSEDRQRILQEQSRTDYVSSEDSDEIEEEPDQPSTPPKTTSFDSTVTDPTSVGRGKTREKEEEPYRPSTPPKTTPFDSTVTDSTSVGRGKTREIRSSTGKTTVTSSGRAEPIFAPGATNNKDTDAKGRKDGEIWEHTKKWSRDLQRKYELERDPEQRALMREVGRDLDRWVTEEEIEEASRLLDQGVEGQQEFVRKHYERTKAKIKEQREKFGWQAMMDKYSEYKPEQEEPELWWFDLPYVLCIGLQSIPDGEDDEIQSGLYSVDVSPALEALNGVDVSAALNGATTAFHTVAFQDRSDAHNYCSLLRREASKIGASRVDIIPYAPQELYKDAKEEGYKVTVIKKGQLQLSIDQPLEEAEARVMELGSARYIDDMVRDRTIDMSSVIDEGFGYGQNPQR